MPTRGGLSLVGDRAYLQFLGEQVAAAEEVRRTDVDADDGMQLTVGFPELGEVILDVPDLSGETLRLLVEDRTWHPHLLAVIERADALLLFVHPAQMKLPIRIDFTAEILANFVAQNAPMAEAAQSVDTDGAEQTTPPRFSSRMACTAAKLVDAIENVLALKRSAWPVRLAIVVSAWDTVDGDPTPNAWLERELPAIHSLCNANADRITVATFGVSAQGGRLPQDRAALLDKGTVLHRCFARDETGEPVPLSSPLEWALSR